MKVHLAGYNVDTTILDELQLKCGKRQDLTPEVLSAAYARISRDPRPINEIRDLARQEVEKTRKSNSTIIFKMGHHSVAEHAVFNLDILGVSRFAMEEVEKFRLSSYTEKSQRYITLDKDFVIPEEIKDSIHLDLYKATIADQNRAYFELYNRLKEHVFKKHADLAKDPKQHNLLEGWAKEDARYITSLATESQVGLTINARNLELMLRRFASCPLREIQALGSQIYQTISDVAPSIVLFYQANDRDSKTYPNLKKITADILKNSDNQSQDKAVVLTDFNRDSDNIISAALLHSCSAKSYNDCKQIVDNLSEEEKLSIFKTAWENMQLYDSMLREFEYTNLTYNIVLSSACFGQLKRHRMSTITSQDYSPSLGVTVPQSIKDIGMEKYFMEVIDKTNENYAKIKQDTPNVAPYILTNAHRKRVLIRVNARELYHISRLRQDAHAQWDIQNVSWAMVEEAKKVMPLTLGLIGGKDQYNDVYKNVFGRLPKIAEVNLPEKRSIKET